MAHRTLEQLRARYNSAAPDRRRGGMGMGMGPRGRGGRMGGPVGKPKNTAKTVRRILTYVRPYWVRILFTFLLMLANTGASLVSSYMLRPIINNLVKQGVAPADKIAGLTGGLMLLGGVYIVSMICTYCQARLMLHVSQGALEAVRNDLFTKVQGLPIRFFDRENTGDIMSRFTNDVDSMGALMDTTLLSLVSGVISVIGTLVMMVYTNVWLALITVAFAPLIVKGGTFIAGKSRKYYAEQQAALGAINGYIEESVTGQKVVKVFNHEDTCVEEFSLLNDDLRGKQMSAQFFGGIMGPIMGNLSQVSYAVTIGVGGLLCVTSGFDIGGLAVFGNYARQFARPINEISQQMTTVFSALAGAERVFDVMDRPPEETAGEPGEQPPIEGRVRFEDVSFGYLPDKTVLQHITLTAEPGQKIAFVGSTGAGKTTVTNLLNRFYDIDQGVITVDDTDIRRISRRYLRRQVAMVLQDTHLFTGTVRENIRYGRPDATDKEVEQAAKVASAHSFIMRLADGYDTVLEGDGVNLSQGQRQLLNIARAAISKAPILVLDEATSSVDTRTEKHIERGMDRLMKNRTTFVIAHRLSTVRNADVILVLEHGEIIERGDHASLLAQKGRYYELYTGVRELD